MPTQPRTANTFESIEKLTHQVAQPAGELVKEVAGDVKESMGLGVEKSQQIKQSDKAKISQIKQNIAVINQQMAQERKKREQKWQEQTKQQEQVKQVKKVAEKKKESVLQRLIKSREGTKEGMPRASG